MDNGGAYDGKKVCAQIADLFAANNRHVQDFARSLADYWLGTYILGADDMENQPDEANLNKITAFQYFINGDSDEDYSCLSDDDWETLRDFADDSAEEISLDTLEGMMSIVLSNGAL